MLAREVKMETIRRAEMACGGPSTPPTKEEREARAAKKTDANKAVAAKRLAAAMGGGFKKSGRDVEERKRAKSGGSGVTYKYNEGFTNAVRRVVFLRDLL